MLNVRRSQTFGPTSEQRTRTIPRICGPPKRLGLAFTCPVPCSTQRTLNDQENQTVAAPRTAGSGLRNAAKQHLPRDSQRRDEPAHPEPGLSAATPSQQRCHPGGRLQDTSASPPPPTAAPATGRLRHVVQSPNNSNC